MRFVAHPWDVCQNPKKAKIEANALKHGSKVATTFQRCLIIKHLCNKPLAFESSASANSATPALRDRSEKNTRFAGKLNIPESVECCFLSALWSRGNLLRTADTTVDRAIANHAVGREFREG